MFMEDYKNFRFTPAVIWVPSIFGGLPLPGLHEIAGARDEWDDGVAAGFCLALLGRLAAARPGPLLWVARRPDLYAPGIAALGLDPGRLILTCPGSDAEVLWAMEEGLRASALAAVAGEVAEPDDTAARRLQLAAEAGGRPCFLLRRRLYAARRAVVAIPALTRWRVTALPSVEDGPGAARAMPERWPAGLPGRPRWRVELLRCRGAAPTTHRQARLLPNLPVSFPASLRYLPGSKCGESHRFEGYRSDCWYSRLRRSKSRSENERKPHPSANPRIGDSYRLHGQG